MRVVIIDDEPLAVELLALYVKQTPFLELVGTYNSAVEAQEALMNSPVDLVLLDIQMPEMSGMDLARQLPESTLVIFTTAFDRYAVESYQVNALDYLMKPISYDVFLASVQKALKRFIEMGEAHDEPFLFVKSDYKRVKIYLRDILYIEGLKDYVKIHVRGDAQSTSAPRLGAPAQAAARPVHIVTLLNMKALEEYLPTPEFMRVHRSFIVHMKLATSIDRQNVYIGSHAVPVSESYKDAVQQYIAHNSI